MTGAGIVERHSGRPFLVALATLNMITGVAAAATLVPLSFGADVDFLRRGAEGLLDGVPVADFVFTPLCALVAVPLTLLPAQAAGAAVLLIELAVLLVGIAVETRTLRALDRVLVAVAVVFAIPVVNELLLGQVTILIAASIYPMRDKGSLGRGIPLGVGLALVPKPLLFPLIVWMLVWRRRALVGALATAALLTFGGVIMLGAPAYGDWFAALRGAGDVTRQANFSVWSNGLSPIAVILAAATVVAFAASLRDRRLGFVAALPAGILLAPYSLTYALSVLVVVLQPSVASAPRAFRGLVVTTNVAVVLVPLVWAASWLVLPAADRRLSERAPDG